jgi:Fic family protein
MMNHEPTSAPGRIAEYFRQNPEEELLIGDVYAKFDVNPKTLRTAIRRLKEEGVLESVHVIRVKRGGAA